MRTWPRVDWRRLAVDRRVVDGTLVVACLFFAVLAVKTPWSPLPRGVIAVAGILGSLAQWPRRRWPQLAAVGGAGAFVLSGNPAPLLVGLYAGAVYAPRRQVWAYGVVAWAGFVGGSWLDDGQVTVDEAASLALFVGLVGAVGVHLAARTAQLESMRERAARVEAERLLRDEQARTAERARIAREMHDVLAHKVSLIALYAGALELQSDGGARLRQSAGLIRVTAREALQELRDVLGMLYAGPDEQSAPGEPFADLESLVRASAHAGHPVELHDTVGPLPAATARVVHRIVQEGLTNARKHAPGAPTTVSVSRDDNGSVTVTVHNEGGVAAPIDLPGSGAGLIGLAERIRLVGGSLQSGPVGDHGKVGWQLRAVVPWLDQRIDEQAGVDAP